MASSRPVRPSRTNAETTKTLGKGSVKSGAKSKSATDASTKNDVELMVPLAPDGKPLVMIEMAASELIPTGDFANITVGPARIRAWIDPREDEPLTSKELENIAKATNHLAEVVEVDVVAVQRNLVLENMQSQTTED